MSHTGAVIAAIGQTIELIGAGWLLIVAWRASRGSKTEPSSYEDVLNIRQRITAGGFGGGAVTVILGLACSVIGSWMQV